jgi:hypothetical protein
MDTPAMWKRIRPGLAEIAYGNAVLHDPHSYDLLLKQ